MTPLYGDPPGFSVIIPTYQRRDSLLRVLSGLAAQLYPRTLIDVLVVCDGGIDGTAEMIRARPYPFPVRVLEEPNQGPAAARNPGLAQARGPFVLFLDDDVVPTPCLLAEHARAHGNARDLAVIGPLLPPVGLRAPWIRYETQTLEKQYQAMEDGRWAPSPRQFYTGNASVRLEHLRRAGGFDAAFRRAEDVELGFRLQRLGVKFVFHRLAAATHIASRPFAAWLRNAYEYGQADVAMAQLKGESHILESVAREFHWRHPYTRRLVRFGLRHRRIASPLPVVVRLMARLAMATGRSSIAYGLCSGIFNLYYWYGLSDRLGAVQAVEALLASQAGLAASMRSERFPVRVRP